MKMGLAILLVALSLNLIGCGLLPSSKNITVPFTSQAPADNWSEPWKNACEEASIYMVASFYSNDTIKRDEATKRIREILAVKNKEFRVSKDESLEKISELIALLGLPWKTEIAVNPTLEEIKEQLVANQPIIAPVYAPALNYSAGGPDYHVMVITGYDDASNEFIVNDPAQKNGKGIRFEYGIFMKAIHNLNRTNYQAGENALLFTKPNEEIGWFE